MGSKLANTIHKLRIVDKTDITGAPEMNYQNLVSLVKREITAPMLVAFCGGLIIGGVLVNLYLNSPAANGDDTHFADFSLTRSLPTALSIPKLDVDLQFTEPVGIGHDDQIAVPTEKNRVAWYQNSPTPGENGPAVVIAHLARGNGEGLPAGLVKLRANDIIEIRRQDSHIATFAVTRVKQNRHSGFPTEAIYQDRDYAGLRLVTWTEAPGGGYKHELVVYARLVSVR